MKNKDIFRKMEEQRKKLRKTILKIWLHWFTKWEKNGINIYSEWIIFNKKLFIDFIIFNIHFV